MIYLLKKWISFKWKNGEINLLIKYFLKVLFIDMKWFGLMRIPAHGICVLWLQWTNSHRLQKSWGEKGRHGHSLSEREGKRARESPREHNPCLDRFLLLFWAHYMRMVLIYYAQVHYRWLPFTDNQGQNAANYFKEKDVTAQGRKWLNWLHFILGWFSTDFRKLKILSKHLLPQSRLREF